MVDSVADDLCRRSGEPPRVREPSDGTPSSLSPYEQLTLEATVVGPGMRTEDHYERGARLKIKGERGVFVYKHASVSSSGLVSLHLSGESGSRAVRPDQVTPVRRRAQRQRGGKDGL